MRQVVTDNYLGTAVDELSGVNALGGDEVGGHQTVPEMEGERMNRDSPPSNRDRDRGGFHLYLFPFNFPFIYISI